MIRALFINSGILGLKTFARFVENAFSGHPDIRATQIVLSDGLTLPDRAVRRLLCLRLWPDGVAGLRNLDYFRFRAEMNAGLLARRRIRQMQRAGGPFDVLHFHRQATAYASLDLMRTTPSIVSIDCTQRCVVQSAPNELVARTYLPNVRRDGAVFRAAKLIVSTSDWAARCVKEEYPDCTTEIIVMPNPVQLGVFDAAWIQERYARATRATGYRPRVLFMGGDFARKGGPDLLAAWGDGRFGDRASLDLVTGVPIDANTLPAGVTVHRNIAVHTPQWLSLWREADLFVLPTHDEAFGLVFQEAAAAGLPAIGTRINAVPELVDEGITGLLIEPGDRHALARALDDLLHAAERRRQMGEEARARIVARASDDVYRDRLAAAIRHVARP